MTSTDKTVPTSSTDIADRHPLALDDLRTMIHHPRSLARPSASWRPPVKALPSPRHGAKLNAAIIRRRVGPRARARIQGFGEKHVPVYLVEVRISERSGGITDHLLAEAWIRALVSEDYAGAVHEIPSGRTVTFVWLADSSFQPVYSPSSMFEGLTAA